jgi:hypothetical protein
MKHLTYSSGDTTLEVDIYPTGLSKDIWIYNKAFDIIGHFNLDLINENVKNLRELPDSPEIDYYKGV